MNPGDAPSERGSGSARPLAHLLLVAGARGAGKSTFIGAVQTGRVDGAILACLPRNTMLWPLVEAQHHANWMPRIAPGSVARVDRLILHCDLVTMEDPKLEPALDALKLARRITAVAVKPDIARLAVQFGARVSQEIGRVASGELIATTGPADQAGQVRHVDTMRQTVLRRYSERDWVEQLYAAWNGRVTALASGADLRLVEVQPIDPGPSGEFRWALRKDNGAGSTRN
jgi:hypothetical protein